MLSLSQAHALLPGSVLRGDGALRVERVHTDTRTLRPGDLFVALRGERFDANEFLPQAKQAGATAAVAERGLSACGLAGLEVSNSLWALQTLAAGWRRTLQLPVIAVTGSNGKTTVTQMVASILRAWKGDQALATEGNFNNHIGVPLTLLRLRAQHQAAVLELGMNHPGEIAGLATMTAPDVALINNAQREHQEFMSTVRAVAEENGAVLAALPSAGAAVYPADDAFAPLWKEMAGARRTLTFAWEGTDVAADVTGRAQWQGDGWRVQAKAPEGTLSFDLHMAGRHNVKNGLAAASAALAVGVPAQAIEAGLQSFRAVKGRSCLMSCRLQSVDVTLVDDTYNANPDSVRAAVEVLVELPGPRWLILGDMGEVGDQGWAFHEEVGAYARDKGIEQLWCAGTLCAAAAQAYGPGAREFADTPSLVQAIEREASSLPWAQSILVKGSRFMAMERVVQALTSQGRQHAA